MAFAGQADGRPFAEPGSGAGDQYLPRHCLLLP
jgi:hypothetical protein